jgi:hypothetical protein
MFFMMSPLMTLSEYVGFQMIRASETYPGSPDRQFNCALK